jgi:hypothetical protein
MEVLSFTVQIAAGPKAGPPACSAIAGHGRLRRSKTNEGSAGASRGVGSNRAVDADLASGGEISWDIDAGRISSVDDMRFHWKSSLIDCIHNGGRE